MSVGEIKIIIFRLARFQHWNGAPLGWIKVDELLKELEKPSGK